MLESFCQNLTLDLIISLLNIHCPLPDIQIILVISLAFLLDLPLSLGIASLTLLFPASIQDEVQILAVIDELATCWKAIRSMLILVSCLLWVRSLMDSIENLTNGVLEASQIIHLLLSTIIAFKEPSPVLARVEEYVGSLSIIFVIILNEHQL